MTAVHLAAARARGAFRRARIAWLRWRLKSTQQALQSALAQPAIGPEFVAKTCEQMNHFEHDIAALSN